MCPTQTKKMMMRRLQLMKVRRSTSFYLRNSWQEGEEKANSESIDMDIDTKATPARSQKKPQRVQKQRNRKPRNSIVFKAKSSGKDKKGSKRKWSLKSDDSIHRRIKRYGGYWCCWRRINGVGSLLRLRAYISYVFSLFLSLIFYSLFDESISS